MVLKLCLNREPLFYVNFNEMKTENGWNAFCF